MDSKLTLKNAKLSIEKFNSSISVHLEQLRSHKRIIQKLLQQSENKSSYETIKKEELNAIRKCKQIKTQIVELQNLRNQLDECEREEFDRRIVGKNEALLEIQSFFGTRK